MIHLDQITFYARQRAWQGESPLLFQVFITHREMQEIRSELAQSNIPWVCCDKLGIYVVTEYGRVRLIPQ